MWRTTPVEAISGYTIAADGRASYLHRSSQRTGRLRGNLHYGYRITRGHRSSRWFYLYMLNALSNTISGLQLDPTDGSLRQIQNTPFTASTLPTCLVTVPTVPLKNSAVQLVVDRILAGGQSPRDEGST